jgi:hypothetical protein
MTTYYAHDRKLLAELDPVVLDLLRQAYRAWYEHGGIEPLLTTVAIRDALAERTDLTRTYKWACEARRKTMLHDSLERLLKMGHLDYRSINSRHSTARVWFPAAQSQTG